MARRLLDAVVSIRRFLAAQPAVFKEYSVIKLAFGLDMGE
jgi:hypothetical protein